MALNNNDELMIKACESKIKLFVVKQNRYNNAIKALKETTNAGRLGELFMGTVR